VRWVAAAAGTPAVMARNELVKYLLHGRQDVAGLAGIF
jgi:hypothetical protein